MEPFSAAFLKTLGGEFAKGTISRLKQQVTSTPVVQALEHCLQVGLIALVAQSTAAEPEQEVELASLFDEFFHDPDVWTEIARLIQDKSLDHGRLMESFVEAGYDPETLPQLDFTCALDAFAAAYVAAAEWQSDLHGVIQTARARQQLDAQQELLAQMKTLVEAVSERTAIGVRAGQVLAAGSERPIWQIGKYVAADEVHGPKFDMSGDYRGATLHITTQYMNAPGEPLWSQEDFSAALRRYLDWAGKRYGRPQLRGIEKRERELPDITLEKVYVSLAVVPDPESDDEKSVRRSRPGLAVASPEEIERPEPVDMGGLLRDNTRLVITGAPGSGKTTYLYVIASTLARAMRAGQAEEAQAALGLEGPLPLPIYISLGDYNRYRLGRREPGDPEHGTLLAYARYALIRQLGGLNLPKDFFERLLTQGRTCVFLLDGLDEVVDERHRQIVSGDVENLSYIDDVGRIVVTSRTRAYVGESKLPPTFHRVEVQPMTPEQVDELAGRWCSVVYDPVDAASETAQLRGEIARLEEHRRERGEERRLADSPLLVTIIAIVHYNDRHLPEQRAALYKSCIHVLLAETHHTKGEARHDLEDWGGTEDDKRELLTLLAYHMMTAGEKAGRTVTEATLKKWLRPRIVRRRGEADAGRTLDDFLQAMAERASLLHERDRVYEFIHLSFQEFLCATYLAHELPDVAAITAFLTDNRHVTDSWWRETILLTPGYLSIDNRTAALNLLQRLATLPMPDAVALAAAELAAAAYLELNFSDQPTCDVLSHRLAALLTDESLAAPNPLRGLAGVALGRLGDPRADVNCPIPFTVPIPAGPFIMGSKKGKGKDEDELAYEDEEPRHEVILPAYKIGKYPVTVAQYRRFVEEGKGYETARYWTPAGWEQRRKEGWAAPRWWDDPQWTVDNHPVVGVSWYEAVAYCNWLNVIKPRDRGFFRLPDEAMLEKAARGTDGRRWPWGNDWDPTKLNSGDGGIGRTSAVGIFPTGRMPEYGVYDAAGNVLEWCSSPGYREAKYPLTLRSYQEDLKLSVETRALRGGSWGLYDRNTRAAYRYNLNPHSRTSLSGSGWSNFSRS